jgi:hypothetical protein
MGQFYRFCNNKLNTRSSVGAIRKSNGELTSDPKEKAEMLNEYFSSVFTVDDCSVATPRRDTVFADSDPSPRTAPTCHKVDFNSHIVHQVLRKRGSKTSVGPDMIPNLFLKKEAQFLAYPLSELFHKSFQSGYIPDIWKLAYVTPIYKKGNQTDPANYRPISLTSTCGKVMEKIIKNSMMSYLLTNDIITKEQHGFLAKHSTASNLLECLHDWIIALESSELVDAVYIDFSRAFDSVVHTKLLHKLQSVGIAGKLYNWIAEFLTDRSQCTVIANVFSSFRNVLSGVIQGSCLGPLLFLIFINDIDAIVDADGSCKMFADDLKLYSSYCKESTNSTIQSMLDNLQAWSVKWQLSINHSKCKVLHLDSSRVNCIHTDYYINGVKLPSDNCVNDLGVLIDNKLRYKEHIGNICSKAYSRIALLFRGFISRDASILVRACKVWNWND